METLLACNISVYSKNLWLDKFRISANGLAIFFLSLYDCIHALLNFRSHRIKFRVNGARETLATSFVSPVFSEFPHWLRINHASRRFGAILRCFVEFRAKLKS